MKVKEGFGGIANIKCKCRLNDEEINQIKSDLINSRSFEKIEKLRIFRKHGKSRFEGWEI